MFILLTNALLIKYSTIFIIIIIIVGYSTNGYKDVSL